MTARLFLRQSMPTAKCVQARQIRWRSAVAVRGKWPTMQSMNSLDGKVAVVTGGNSGIGRAIAEALAAAGVRVMVAGRREEANRRVAGELREKHGVDAEAMTTDVAIESDCVSLIAQTRERYGRLDILINNAGIGGWGSIAETSTEDFDRVLKTNLYGAFWCAREAFRAMSKNPEKDRIRGSIVNISSIAGKEAWSGTGTYSVSKFGMMALTQSLADEGKSLGIRATAVRPALVVTPMTGASGSEALLPEDIAETVLYLLRLSPAAWPTEIALPRRGAE